MFEFWIKKKRKKRFMCLDFKFKLKLLYSSQKGN